MDKEKLKFMPDLPGVYIMKDKEGSVLYVGKAISLKKRVSSYFRSASGLSPRIRIMAGKVDDIAFVTTGSVALALITEAALIKKYKPRYNVALKDDKSYPHLKLTANDDFPRLMLTRKLENDGSFYYGPYTDVKLLRKALSLMKKIFPLALCGRLPKKACLNYQIGQCYAPCVKAISKEAYRDITEELKLFLDGKREELIDGLSRKMQAAAEKKDYEKAAVLRDRIRALSVIPSPALSREGTVFAGKKQEPYDEIMALKFLLGMKRAPRRIEAFDISNISGKQAVGSMVTFIDGKPSKDDYRKFRIRTVEGIDDYKMMKEVLRRRYERVKAEKLPCPDLIIIDGGKGQLNTALEVLEELGFGRLEAIGIAKRFEHIFLKKRKEPVIFSRHSPVLHLIERLRDEAHRFAITYHRRLRAGKLRESILDGIAGIGEKRKMLLLNKFGSVEKIKEASAEELCSVGGISTQLAEKIRKAVTPDSDLSY